jgi:predicted RNA-binding Zn ribbon-like protein
VSGVESIALLGGDTAVDFANTVSYHAGDDERGEYLTDYRDVVRWARRVNAISESEVAALMRGAERHPILARRAHERVVQLRETVYRTLTACAHNRTPQPADIVALHEAAVEAQSAATPRWHNNQMTLAWPLGDDADLMRPLYPVLIAARELLMSDRMLRLGQCDNHPCGWLFIDTSRNGKRRWCSSAECGNQARVRRFRDKL